ncbi:MAG: diacylglycerol kinase [Runella slithyformis]|nr:MAG: diacylglycerol kinase [Runella slithyformis]
MQYWFIINPKSGTQFGQKMAQLESAIAEQTKLPNDEIIFKMTAHAGHATDLAREAVAQHIDVVVAVGGDGTVNEVARGLLHSQVVLGIVPMGSGNGLARHLGISMNVPQATKRIFNSEKQLIDSALINNIPFFCTAGAGFDAHVAAQFARQTRRGFFTYIKTSLLSFWQYQPQVYSFGGQHVRLFALTFANASQFGNNAYIAPQASTQDGLLDVCQLKPFSAIAGLAVAWRLFGKSLDKSRYANIERYHQLIVTTETPPLIHYDGESLQLTTNELRVEIVPKSLWVR